MTCARFVVAAQVIGLAVAAVLQSAGPCHAQENSPKTSPVAISNDRLPVGVERAFANLDFPQEHPPESPGITGGVRPIFITNPGDGTNRIAVMGQLGHVWLFPNKDDVEQAVETLDISPEVVYNEAHE